MTSVSIPISFTGFTRTTASFCSGSTTNPLAAFLTSPVGSFRRPAFLAPPIGARARAVIADTYRLQLHLASGGMGSIYSAEHLRLNKLVAIKLLHDHYVGDVEMEHRFLYEAIAVVKIHHAGVVNVFDYGRCEDGTPYIVMELLNGHSLSVHLKQRRLLNIAAIATIGAALADALYAAHEVGVIHRDLKPSNIFLLSSSGFSIGSPVKILDFGVAKIEGVSLTCHGKVVGTPAFMSPEQCRGKRIDHRSDIYALGCVLYTLICRRKPFTGSYIDTLRAQIRQPPPPMSSEIGDVPPALRQLVARMLAKSPDDRPSSMLEVEQELTAILRDLPR